MNKEGNKLQQSQERARQFVPSIPEVMLQYNNLSEEQQAINHGKLAKMIDASVVKAVTDYAQSGRGEEEKRDFVKTLEHVATMNVPPSVKQAVMTKAVDRTFDFESNMTNDERNAWATVTLRAGGNEVAEARAEHLIKAHENSYKELNKSPSATIRLRIAEQLLGKMGFTIETIEDPSIGEVVVTAVRTNSRKAAVTGITAVTAGSILIGGNAAFAGTPTSTPGLVGGGETTSTSMQMTPETSSAKLAASPKPGVSASINLDAKTATVQISGTEVQNATAVKGTVAIPTAVKAQPAVATTESNLHAKPDVSISPAVSINTADTKAEALTLAAPADTEKATSVKPALLAPDIETTVDTSGTETIPTPTAVTMNTTPSVSTVETKIIGPDGKTVEMTKAQKLLAGIQTSISSGDVFTAVGMIVAHYHDKSAAATNFDAKGKAIIPVTNQRLLDSLAEDPSSSVESKTLDAIHGGAHSDPNYTGNILSAMTVIEAAAHDQTILDNPDVQSLTAKAVRPTDQYGGKLFDKYLDTGTKLLQTKDADGHTLLDNFTDAHAKTIENLYAYVLMGQDSDADQKAQETAMQKADEAAAAAAAAAAAESAGGNYQQGIQQAAQANGWTHFKAQVMLALAANGVALPQASAIAGNFSQESGPGMAPNAQERPGSDYYGLGFAQMTAGRHTTYVAAAQEAGFDPYNDTSDAFINWQVAFIVNQAKDSYSETWANMQTTNDVPTLTNIWSDGFEGAGIPMESKRIGYATDTFNQINGQIQAIQAAQAAAAEKAKAEAAAEAAANHMSNGQDILNDLSSKFSNGNLENSGTLTTLNSPHIDYNGGEGLNSDGPGPFELNTEAANQLYKLAAAYSAQFGTNLTLAAGYRSMQYQQNQREYWSGLGKPGNAASPGHSNHGWGLAIDLDLANGAKGAAEHQWLVANAPNYGWVWPNVSGEDWHFEYMGSAAQGNNSDSPEPGLDQS